MKQKKPHRSSTIYSKMSLSLFTRFWFIFLKHYIDVEGNKQFQYEQFFPQLRLIFLRNLPFSIYEQWQENRNFN